MSNNSSNFYQNTEKVKSHYKNLSKNYDDLWEYSKDFIEFISGNISKYLELKSTDIFLDLGCGTGLFTKEIYNQISFEKPVICSDISKDMLSYFPDSKKYKCISMDAVEFSFQPFSFDKILIKEMIHHLNEKQQETLIDNLFDRLNNGGKFLLILLPLTLEYPLFKTALDKHKELQPDYMILANLFEEAGFQTEINMVKYPLNLSKSKYFQMVKNRYMSLLSSFTDLEIEKGLNEMEEKYININNLAFNDVFVFITGTKC